MLGIKKKEKKDKKVKDAVVEAPVAEETEVEAPVAEETEVEDKAPEVVAEAGTVTFRSSGHTKLYAKLDPESRYAKNMVRRHAK